MGEKLRFQCHAHISHYNPPVLTGSISSSPCVTTSTCFATCINQCEFTTLKRKKKKKKNHVFKKKGCFNRKNIRTFYYSRIAVLPENLLICGFLFCLFFWFIDKMPRFENWRGCGGAWLAWCAAVPVKPVTGSITARLVCSGSGSVCPGCTEGLRCCKRRTTDFCHKHHMPDCSHMPVNSRERMHIEYDK